MNIKKLTQPERQEQLLRIITDDYSQVWSVARTSTKSDDYYTKSVKTLTDKRVVVVLITEADKKAAARLVKRGLAVTFTPKGYDADKCVVIADINAVPYVAESKYAYRVYTDEGYMMTSANPNKISKISYESDKWKKEDFGSIEKAQEVMETCIKYRYPNARIEATWESATDQVRMTEVKYIA